MHVRMPSGSEQYYSEGCYNFSNGILTRGFLNTYTLYS